MMGKVPRTRRAPSPRSCGERVGVRGNLGTAIHAPHPTPLPVKDGEREQAEFAASVIRLDEAA